MRLLPLMLAIPLHAADLPLPASTGGEFDLKIEMAQETRGDRSILVAAGETSLPDGTILRGTLHYRTEGRPAELIPIRKELVKNGAYAMPFDAGFTGPPFPGVYEVTITPDSLAGQPRTLHQQLGRKIRLLKWTGTLEVGGPGEALKAELRMRETWRKAIRSLDPLAAELSQTFERHAARPSFDAVAWDTWHADWAARLQRDTDAPSSNALSIILPRLHPDWLRPGINPPWVIRDHMVHEIGEAASHGRTALRTMPRQAAYVQRVQDIIAYYRQQIALVLSNLPLLRPAPAETREIADRLRGDLDGLRSWLQAAKLGEAGHAAPDWAAWSGAWRVRMGTDLMRLSEGSLEPELAQATQDFATACQELSAVAERIVAGDAQAPPVDPLVETARKALDTIAEVLSK